MKKVVLLEFPKIDTAGAEIFYIRRLFSVIVADIGFGCRLWHLPFRLFYFDELFNIVILTTLSMKDKQYRRWILNWMITLLFDKTVVSFKNEIHYGRILIHTIIGTQLIDKEEVANYTRLFLEKMEEE